MLRSILPVIGLIAGLALGAWSLVTGTNLQAIVRQLDRTPEVALSAVLPGLNNVSGQAMPYEETLRAPGTGTECFYFYYTIEEERRDSDGDTYWATIHSETSYRSFMLVAGSGRLLLNPVISQPFDVARSNQWYSGDRRYTEYRIDPYQTVVALGDVVGEEYGEYRMVFTGEVSAELISTKAFYDLRSARARESVWALWGSSCGFLLLLLCGLILLERHRLILFLVLTGLLAGATLGLPGLMMLLSDLGGAVEQCERRETEAAAEIEALLSTAGVEWDGSWTNLPTPSDPQLDSLDAFSRERLAGLARDLHRLERRVEQQQATFPDNVVATVFGHSYERRVELPDAYIADADKLESAYIPLRFGTFDLIVGIIALIGVIPFTWFGLRRFRIKRYIENVPTTEIGGIAYGLAEINGKLIPEDNNLLRGPMSGKSCVQYHYVVTEKRGSGKDSRWVTVRNEKNAVPFICQDSSGQIRVIPTGAELITRHKVTRTMNRQSHTETHFLPEDDLYVLGSARINAVEHDRLEIRNAQEESDVPFLISNYEERRVMLRKASASFVLLYLGMCCAMLGCLNILGFLGNFSVADVLLSSLAAPAFLFVVTFITYFNDLVFLRQRADRAWANIEVSLVKRRDLVAQLQKVVQGYLAHEKQVLAMVAGMRADFANANEASKRLQKDQLTMGRLFALQEAYPELKANSTTDKLFRTLQDIENELAIMRAGFNNAVERYNTKREHFPELFVAAVFRFPQLSYYRV